MTKNISEVNKTVTVFVKVFLCKELVEPEIFTNVHLCVQHFFEAQLVKI